MQSAARTSTRRETISKSSSSRERANTCWPFTFAVSVALFSRRNATFSCPWTKLSLWLRVVREIAARPAPETRPHADGDPRHSSARVTAADENARAANMATGASARPTRGCCCLSPGAATGHVDFQKHRVEVDSPLPGLSAEFNRRMRVLPSS